MANSSFNLTRTAGSANMNYRCVWSSAPNNTANTSDLTVWVYASKSASASQTTYGTVNTTVNVDGTSQSENGLALSVAPGHEQLIFAKLYSGIGHNSDGSKTVNISVTIGGNIVGASGSQNVTLDTIPRASVPTLSSDRFNIGDTITIYTNSRSSSFTHTIKYYWTDQYTGTIPNGTGIYTSQTWTVPLALCNAIPDSTFGQGNITLYTYDSGGNLVGTNTVYFTADVPASVKPVCDFAVSDSTSCYGTFGNYVRLNSRLLITTSTTPAYSASIKSYTVTFEGKQYNSQTATTDPIAGSGTLPVKVKVTDSRGRMSDEVTKNITVLPYEAPAITLQAYRCVSDGTRSEDGAFIKIVASAQISSLDNQNSATYLVKYKTSDAQTWTETTGSGTTYASNAIPFDVAKAGAVEVAFTDLLSSTAKATVIPIAFTLIDSYSTGKGISFGEVATKNGFVCALDAEFKGGFQVSAMPDYITEQGVTNDGWYFQKFKSGLAKLYTTVSVTYANSYVLGNTISLPFTLATMLAGISTLNNADNNSFNALSHNVKLTSSSQTNVDSVSIWEHSANGDFTQAATSKVSVMIIGIIQEEA